MIVFKFNGSQPVRQRHETTSYIGSCANCLQNTIAIEQEMEKKKIFS